MTLMAVPVDGVLATIYDLAEVDEASAQLLLQMGVWDALCAEVSKADWLEPVLAGPYARLADNMLERTAKAYTIAKAEGRDTTELEVVAEHLATARDGWVTIGKMTPEEYDAYVAQGRIQKDPQTGRFVSHGVRGRILGALGLAQRTDKDEPVQRATQQALAGLVGDQADAYSRMRALGAVLTSNGSSTGQAARLVATVGPEAQRALEPGIRRAAYRYRGTERRPDRAAQNGAVVVAASAYPEEIADLPEGLQAAVARASAEVEGGAGESARQLMAAPGRRAPAPAVLSPVAGAIAANPERQGWTDDQLRLARTSDYGALLLRKQIPSLDDAELSLAAGKMPPSVGMMFDADGRLVSEAQGYNGDHYLPFDLKNLKRLKGGSYVRTRTTGGLTDEDIYTGLMTGARQVTVISNSGVFTAEFDPDLRGGRRYSDKARQMVERYAALTDVIGGGKLQQTDLPPETMKALRDNAIKRGGSNAETVQAIFRQSVEAERFRQNFLGVDEDELMAQADELARHEFTQANRMGGNKPGMGNAGFQQARAKIFADLKAEAQQGQAKAYRLDYDGYTAAQKALKTEFPYYLRDVRSMPLHEFLISRKALAPNEDLPRRGGRDIGYTRRGQLATLLDHRGAIRDEDLRTGRKPSALGGGARTAPTEKPQTDSANVAVDVAPAEKAVPLTQAASQARDIVKHGLGDALRPVLAERRRLVIQQEAMVDADNVTIQPGHADVARQSPLEMMDWLADSSVFRNPSAAADFLLDPDNAHLLPTVRAGVQEMLDERHGFELDPDEAEQLVAMLDIASGAGFATPSGDPVLQRPDESDPQPVLFPQIDALGASQTNIANFVRANPDVAPYAAEIQAGEDPVAEISMATQEIARLAKWGKEGGEPPRGLEGREEEAQILASNPEASELYTTLRNRQLAWSLVKANQITELVTDRDGVDFTELAEELADPKEEAAKRAAPVVVHKHDSAAALGLMRLLASQTPRRAGRR